MFNDFKENKKKWYFLPFWKLHISTMRLERTDLKLEKLPGIPPLKKT